MAEAEVVDRVLVVPKHLAHPHRADHVVHQLHPVCLYSRVLWFFTLEDVVAGSFFAEENGGSDVDIVSGSFREEKKRQLLRGASLLEVTLSSPCRIAQHRAQFIQCTATAAVLRKAATAKGSLLQHCFLKLLLLLCCCDTGSVGQVEVNHQSVPLAVMLC